MVEFWLILFVVSFSAGLANASTAANSMRLFQTTWAASRAQVVKPTPTPTPSVSVSPSPKASPLPLIGFNCATCTSEEKVKVEKAQKAANAVVRGECFKQFMIKRPMIQMNGKTQAQVIEHLRAASVTVPVHYYHSWKGTIGYRNPGYPDVYFNRKFHNAYKVCETASNATHEWSHVLGYEHAYKRTSNRGLSVPYSINHAFDACCVEAQYK